MLAPKDKVLTEPPKMEIRIAKGKKKDVMDRAILSLSQLCLYHPAASLLKIFIQQPCLVCVCVRLQLENGVLRKGSLLWVGWKKTQQQGTGEAGSCCHFWGPPVRRREEGNQTPQNLQPGQGACPAYLRDPGTVRKQQQGEAGINSWSSSSPTCQHLSLLPSD